MVVRNYKYKIKKKTGKINGNIVDLITCKVIEPEKNLDYTTDLITYKVIEPC